MGNLEVDTMQPLSQALLSGEKRHLVWQEILLEIKMKFLLMGQINSVIENRVNSTGRCNNPKLICT